MSTLPSTGPLSLTGNIQNEFGGTAPTSMSEYYRDGLYVTPNNVGIPTSTGFPPISISSFRGTYKTSSVASIVQALYTDANFSTVRNQLFSKTSFGLGMETSTAGEFNDSSSATYRFSTSVTNSRTWPSSFDAAFDPMLSTSGVTVIMRNVGNSGLTNSLTLNGFPYGISLDMTTVFAGQVGSVLNARISYAFIPRDYNGIAGLSLTATYEKSSSNNDNLQELFVIPGKWEAYWATPVTDGLTGATIPSVNAYDLVFGIRTGLQDAFISDGTWSGTASRNRVMQRNSRLNTNTSSHVQATTSTGSVTFTPGRFSSTNHSGMACAFTCVQV